MAFRYFSPTNIRSSPQPVKRRNNMWRMKSELSSGIPIREPTIESKNAELASQILRTERETNVTPATTTPATATITHPNTKRLISRKLKAKKTSSIIPVSAKSANTTLLDNVLTPSTNSTFQFTPSYFKPEVLKEHKIDADLATAIAYTSSLKNTAVITFKENVDISKVSTLVKPGCILGKRNAKKSLSTTKELINV